MGSSLARGPRPVARPPARPARRRCRPHSRRGGAGTDRRAVGRRELVDISLVTALGRIHSQNLVQAAPVSGRGSRWHAPSRPWACRPASASVRPWSGNARGNPQDRHRAASRWPRALPGRCPRRSPAAGSCRRARPSPAAPRPRPMSTIRLASSCASCSVFMNAPRPTLTSRTMPLAPAAIFLLMIELAMSGGLWTVAVTSRRA